MCGGEQCGNYVTLREGLPLVALYYWHTFTLFKYTVSTASLYACMCTEVLLFFAITVKDPLRGHTLVTQD